MMLAPRYTMMADEVPDHQKGVAGGLLTLASPIGSALAAVPVATGLGEDGRFALVCGFVAICVVPLLLVRPHPTDTTPPPAPARAIRRGDLALTRPEERRVCKECVSTFSYRVSDYISKKKKNQRPIQ